MNKWRPHRGWYFLIPILALALAAGSIYWFTAGDDSPAPTVGAPAQSPYRDIGAGVAVPQDTTEDVRATADGTATKPPFQQVEQLGAIVHITPDGPLDRPLTLRFKLSRKVKPEDVVFAVNQTGKVQDWQLVAPAKVDGEYAYVTTSHLSWWDPLSRSFTDLVDNTLAELKRQFEGLTGDAFAEAEKPKCDNEQRARDNGYSVAWKGAEVLYWCLDLDGDRPVVRIVNKRRYPIFVNHAGISVPNPPKAKLGVEWLARKSFNDSRTVMLPFDSIQLNYDLGNGQRRIFTTEYNGFAGSLNQLEFGVTTLINILTRFGAGGGTISNGAITITQFDRVAEAMSKALLIKGCADALNTDTPNSGAILSGCFSPSAIADMFGWKGVLLAAVMVVGPVVSFFRSQFDTLGDLLQGKDQETVTVSYTSPSPPKALFVGAWTVHGAQMVINENGTGTYTWNAGPCTQSLDETRMCQGNAALTFKITGDSSMIGTYTRVWYTTGELPAPPDFDDSDSELPP